MRCTYQCPIWVLGILLGLTEQPGPRADDVRVTVVSVLATAKNNRVDKNCECIAKEAQKLDPTLTGFRLGRMTKKGVTVGQRESFPLVEEEAATVVVEQAGMKMRLTVKAPTLGDISYTTCCGKFFPIMTRYQTKDGERLIIAVMVEPVKK